MLSPMTMQSQHDPVTMDISANLLTSYFADRRADRSRKTRQMLLSLTGMLVVIGLVTGLATWSETEKAGVNLLEDRVAKQTRELKAMGGDLPEEAISEKILNLPRQFQFENKKLVGELAFVLSKVPAGMGLQSLRFSVDTDGSPKWSGQVETTDLPSVRRYLDQIQTDLPGSEAMITSVSQAQGEVAGILNISFDIRPAQAAGKPAKGGTP